MEFIYAFMTYAIIICIFVILAMVFGPILAAISIACFIAEKLFIYFKKKKREAEKAAARQDYERRAEAKKAQEARNANYNQLSLEKLDMQKSPLIEKRCKNSAFLYGFPHMPASADDSRAEACRTAFNAITDGGYEIGKGKIIEYCVEGRNATAAILYDNALYKAVYENYDEAQGFDPINFFEQNIKEIEKEVNHYA